MNRIRQWIGVAMLVLPIVGAAHQDAAGEAEDIYSMDCEHPPAAAIRNLPAPLSKWARILCLPAGQLLGSSADAQWRYPSSFTDRVMVAAVTNDDENDAKPRYFISMQIRELPSDEARSQHQRLMKEVAVYGDRITDSKTNLAPQAPKAAWEVIGTNNERNVMHMYVMQLEGQEDMWGLVCAPRCEAHLSFIMTPYN